MVETRQAMAHVEGQLEVACPPWQFMHRRLGRWSTLSGAEPWTSAESCQRRGEAFTSCELEASRTGSY